MTKRVLLRQTIPALLALAASAMLHAEPSVPTSRTQCFGRYLIDVPGNAALIGYGNKYQVAEIHYEKTGQAEFLNKISNKELVLKSASDFDADKLEKSLFGASIDKRVILSRAKIGSREIYNISTYKFSAPFHFFSSSAVISSEYLEKSMRISEEYVAQVRYRKDRDIPNEPGFCFENGFVANDGKKPQYEVVTLAFELKDHPDVHVVVESEVLFSQTDSLLQRSAKAGWLSLFDGMHTLRKGTRSVNGLAGEEVLNRYRSDQGGKAHKFRWETLGEQANPLKPDIYVDFQTGFKPGGGSVDSSLSDQEAIALFDQIVNSVRIRPTGAHAKTFDTEPTVVKATKAQAIDSASERGQHD